jgi:hypothetical protein
MKICVVVALVGLAISFALPTFAQQTNTPDPELRAWLGAFDKKHAEPWNKNDAAVIAALFTEDAVYVTARGPVNGRQAIEKYFADLFQKMRFSDHLIAVDQFSPRIYRYSWRSGVGNRRMESGYSRPKWRSYAMKDTGQRLKSVRAMIGKFGC